MSPTVSSLGTRTNRTTSPGFGSAAAWAVSFPAGVSWLAVGGSQGVPPFTISTHDRGHHTLTPVFMMRTDRAPGIVPTDSTTSPRSPTDPHRLFHGHSRDFRSVSPTVSSLGTLTNRTTSPGFGSTAPSAVCFPSGVMWLASGGGSQGVQSSNAHIVENPLRSST